MDTLPSMMDNLTAYDTAGVTVESLVETVTQTSLLGNGSSLGPPSYYSIPYRIVGCFFVSLIFLVGLVGNMMVVIVVARTSSMHTPTNCYLVSLAVADVLVLISATLPTIYEFFLIIDQCIIGKVGCAIMVFLQYLGINASSLSITAFTIERYIAICHPIKSQTMCTVKRAKRIILSLWAFSIAYNSPWLGLTTTIKRQFSDGTTIEACTFKLQRSSYLTIYMADLVIFYICPLIMTCILYGLIARILFRSTIPSTPGKANGINSTHKSRSVTSSRVQVGIFFPFYLLYIDSGYLFDVFLSGTDITTLYSSDKDRKVEKGSMAQWCVSHLVQL